MSVQQVQLQSLSRTGYVGPKPLGQYRLSCSYVAGDEDPWAGGSWLLDYRPEQFCQEPELVLPVGQP